MKDLIISCFREQPLQASLHLAGAIFAAVLTLIILYHLGNIEQQGTVALSQAAERLAGMVGR